LEQNSLITPDEYGIEMLTNDWSRWGQYYFRKPFCQLKDFSAAEIIRSYIDAVATVMEVKPEAIQSALPEFFYLKHPDNLSE